MATYRQTNPKPHLIYKTLISQTLMGMESGIINEVFSSTTGTILRDNGFDPNPVSYDSVTPLGLMVNDKVTYDIDGGNVVTNIISGGTNAPYVVSLDENGDVNPFINTIGDIVWTYVSSGTYLGVLEAGFPEGKTFLSIGPVNKTDYGNVITSDIYRINDNTIKIETNVPGQSGVNDALNNTPIIIEIYP